MQKKLHPEPPKRQADDIYEPLCCGGIEITIRQMHGDVLDGQWALHAHPSVYNPKLAEACKILAVRMEFAALELRRLAADEAEAGGQ